MFQSIIFLYTRIQHPEGARSLPDRGPAVHSAQLAAGTAALDGHGRGGVSGLHGGQSAHTVRCSTM